MFPALKSLTQSDFSISSGPCSPLVNPAFIHHDAPAWHLYRYEIKAVTCCKNEFHAIWGMKSWQRQLRCLCWNLQLFRRCVLALFHEHLHSMCLLRLSENKPCLWKTSDRSSTPSSKHSWVIGFNYWISLNQNSLDWHKLYEKGEVLLTVDLWTFLMFFRIRNKLAMHRSPEDLLVAAETVYLLEGCDYYSKHQPKHISTKDIHEAMHFNVYLRQLRMRHLLVCDTAPKGENSCCRMLFSSLWALCLSMHLNNCRALYSSNKNVYESFYYCSYNVPQQRTCTLFVLWLLHSSVFVIRNVAVTFLPIPIHIPTLSIMRVNLWNVCF